MKKIFVCALSLVLAACGGTSGEEYFCDNVPQGTVYHTSFQKISGNCPDLEAGDLTYPLSIDGCTSELQSGCEEVFRCQESNPKSIIASFDANLTLVFSPTKLTGTATLTMDISNGDGTSIPCTGTYQLTGTSK